MTASNGSASPPPSRRRMPRLSLTAQIYLAVLGLAVAFVLVAAAGWLDAGQQARRRYENQVTDGLQSFQSDLDRATRNLSALGNWVVADGALVNLVSSRDSPGLIRYLQPWGQVSLADTLMVVDPDGAVLARVSAAPPAPGERMSDLPGVAEALAGNRSSRMGQDRAGRLEQRLTWPIYGPPGKNPIGALVLSFYLDGAWLQYRSTKDDEQIAVVYNDRMSILTLTDKQGKPWGGQLAPQEALRAQQERRPSELVQVQTDVGHYLFQFRPLGTGADNSAGMYGIGVSLASVDGERANLFRAFLVGLGLIAVGTAACGALYARSLTRPIRLLERAAEEMASGQLTESIHLNRDDELGDLARQMDRMRLQIQEGFAKVALERRRLAAVIESMGAATIVTDEELKIVAVNPAAETLLKTPSDELLGAPWRQVLADGSDDSSPSRLRLGEAQVGATPALTAHGRFTLRAQPHITLDVISSQVMVNGRPAGFVHVLQDASGQEQLVQARDEFMMNAAHELRSPLASLRASIEVLIEDYAVMEKQELGFMLRTIQRSVVRFQGLVENLVDVGSIQAGRFRARPLPTLLDTLVETARSQVQPLLQGRGQTLELSLNCGPGCRVLADRPRIVQVLINLLSNASKYGPEGEPICLSAFPQDDRVMIEVTDRGLGIPPEEQVQLFKRFYRGRRAEEEGIGIGLGLALAQEIVQAHGGQMEVSSQVGRGATFRFSLRRAED